MAPAPVNIAVPAPMAMASVPAPPPPATIKSNEATHTDSDPQLFVRVPEARRVGEQLLHYLSSTRAAAPPIWNSADAMDAAGQARARLLLHNGQLDAPDWRMREREARLQSAWHARGGNPVATPESGTVQARLVWRENRWLVADVRMESR